MKLEDDYKWNSYTNEYAAQIKNEVSKENTLITKNFDVKENDVFFQDVPPIHPNWAEVYFQVVNKKVKSVLECGCGSGQHLMNISIIAPEIEINGCDLLATQLEFGKEYFNLPAKIVDNVKIFDFTEKDAYQKVGKKVDLCYSQAVVMHLSHEPALGFLENMIQASNKYIVLVEGVRAHDYRSMITEICTRLGIKFKIETTSRYIPYGILITLGG